MHETSPWPASARRVEGELTIAGYAVGDLAAVFGTPAFLLDVPELRTRAAHVRAVASRVGADLGVPTSVYYASKAFSSTAVLRWVHAEGLRVDVSTLGELAVALHAGIPGADLGLHGNNKSVAEIDLALASGVGRIVIDSIPEIALVADRATAAGRVAPVMLRITTGVHAGGHEFIATAHEDQKFGLSLAGGSAAAAVDAVLASEELELIGLHSHIGSQIVDPGGFVRAAELMMGFRAQIAARTEHLLPEIDLGGGFGVAYTPSDDAADLEAILTSVGAAVARLSDEYRLPPPALSFEPGRSIVGPAMVSLYRVGTIKPVTLEDGGVRTYVSVDGGMSDNIRPVLYGARYTTELANRLGSTERVAARVVGKHCESGDILIRDVELPADLVPGDLLAVPVTGAYGRSLASNYNMMPRPGVLALGDGDPRWIVRPETVQDLLALDLG